MQQRSVGVTAYLIIYYFCRFKIKYKTGLDGAVNLCICFPSCMCGHVVSSVLTLKTLLRYNLKHLPKIKLKTPTVNTSVGGLNLKHKRFVYMCSLLVSIRQANTTYTNKPIRAMYDSTPKNTQPFSYFHVIQFSFSYSKVLWSNATKMLLYKENEFLRWQFLGKSE